MKAILAVLAMVLSFSSTQAAVVCEDANKNLEIRISNLDLNADSPIKIDVEIVQNRVTKKFSRSSAIYSGEIAQAVVPAPPAHDLRYIISNYIVDYSGEEKLQSVWSLKIDTGGATSLILAGFSALGVPEYKIICR